MIGRFLRRLAFLIRRRRWERELAEEMETHRALAADGRHAAKAMGNITLAREESRDVWAFPPVDSLVRDVRLAMRGLRRSPMFSLVAIVSLALGIGANTAIFSFVNAILLKRLPVAHPEQLVLISGVVWPLTTVDDIGKRAATLDGIFGWFTKAISFSAGGQAEWIDGEIVTGQYFRTLQVQAAAGRLFNDADVRHATGDPVCVLSYRFWQRQFAGEYDVIGQTVYLNGRPYRVLGVTRRGFYGAALQQRFDVAVPATRVGDFMPAFNGGMLSNVSWLTPLARLKPGVSRAQAEQEIARIVHDSRNRPVRLVDGSQGVNPMRASFGRPALALMGVVGLVLLVACANLANLLLARSQARAHEFAIRLSIGASRGRLIRQLLVESLLLACAGGALGLALSFWIQQTLTAFLNIGRAAAYDLRIGVDADVLGFCILVSLATALLFGWAPAWQATRPDVLPDLQQSTAHAVSSRQLLRRGLVVVQVALALMVVFAAGLLTRTLRTLETIDLGFQPDKVIAMIVDPAVDGHSGAQVSQILDEIVNRTRVLPGVKAASLAMSPPYSSTMITMVIDVPGYSPESPEDKISVANYISPSYFATLGQQILRGRDFNAGDNANRHRVVIVNEKFVQRYFRGGDAIGRTIRERGGDIEVVGVVADARDQGARRGSQTEVYFPEKQAQTSGLVTLVRTSGEARRLIPSLLDIVRSVDERVPVYSIHTLDADVQAGMSSEKILGYLSSLFGGLATLLAGIGLYGVLAYSVTRRTREIGIRLAVGARQCDIAGLFVREGFVLVLAGLGIGGPAALVCSQILRTLLFGVAPSDPLTLAASILFLLLAALVAISIPLRRASRVNPMTALRWE